MTFYINDTESKLVVAKNKEQITFSPPKEMKELELGVSYVNLIAVMNETAYKDIVSTPLRFTVTVFDSIVPTIRD